MTALSDYEIMTDPICFMRYQNYKVSASVGLYKTFRIPVIAVADTGAGPNLIHRRLLPAAWQQRIQFRPTPGLVDAQRNPIKASGVLSLMVQIDQLWAQVQFIVVTNMAVDCILGTSFIDRHVKAIVPPSRRIYFNNSPSVPLVGCTKPKGETSSDGNSTKPKPFPFPSKTLSNKVRASESVLIQPMTQATVMVQTEQAGLVFLQGHPRLAEKKMALAANGVMDVSTKRQFPMLVANFGSTPIRIH